MVRGYGYYMSLPISIAKLSSIQKKHRLKTYYVPGIGNDHVIPIATRTNAMKHSVSVPHRP